MLSEVIRDRSIHCFTRHSLGNALGAALQQHNISCPSATSGEAKRSKEEDHQERIERAIEQVATCTEHLYRLNKVDSWSAVLRLLKRAKSTAGADAETLLDDDNSDDDDDS